MVLAFAGLSTMTRFFKSYFCYLSFLGGFYGYFWPCWLQMLVDDGEMLIKLNKNREF